MTTPFTSSSYNRTQFATDGAGHWVAVAYYGSVPAIPEIAYSSDNGASWTLATSPYTSTNYAIHLTYGNGKFFAIRSDGYLSVSSDSGVTWSTPALIDSSATVGCYGLAYGNSTLVIAGNYSTTTNAAVWRSTNDGTSFTRVDFTLSGVSPNLGSVTYMNGVWVAGGADDSGGAAIVVVSNDNAVSFAQKTLPSTMTSPIQGIASGANIFILADSLSNVVRSTDGGQTWGVFYDQTTSQTTVGMTSCFGAAFTPDYGYDGRFYIVGSLGPYLSYPAVSYSDYVDLGKIATQVDLTYASSDYDLQLHETAVIKFTSATSVPLNIATTAGTEYRVKLSIGSGGVAGVNALHPNNSTYSNQFSYNVLRVTGTTPTYTSGELNQSSFVLGYSLWKNTFDVSNDTDYSVVYGVGPLVDGSGGTSSSMQLFTATWTGTTGYPWTSLGTLVLSASSTGAVYVTRIA